MFMPERHYGVVQNIAIARILARQEGKTQRAALCGGNAQGHFQSAAKMAVQDFHQPEKIADIARMDGNKVSTAIVTPK